MKNLLIEREHVVFSKVSSLIKHHLWHNVLSNIASHFLQWQHLPTIFAMNAFRFSPQILSLELCDEFDNTTGILDLLLSQLREISGSDNHRDLWDFSFAKNLGVTKGNEVENGSGVGLGLGNICVACLLWNERPKLWKKC